MREYQVESIHDVSFLQQKLRQASKALHSSNFGEVLASFWPSHDILESTLEKELDQICMILTYIFVQDQHFGVFCENVCEDCSVQFILEVFVFAKEEKELQVFLAGLYIVLEDDDIAQSVKATAENPQSFIHIKVFLVVLVEDLEYRPSNIDLFEVRSNIISQCQRAEYILFLKYLQKMRRQDYLIMTETYKKRTDLFNDGYVIEIAFFFCHELLAEHCDVIYYVILDHVEHVSLEPQAIAVSNQLQRFRRVYLDGFAFSSEQILQHSDLFEVFVSLKGRVDETSYDIQLQIAIFNLVENKKILVEVDQLFVFCFLDKVVNFIQVFAFKSGFDEQDV